MLVLVLQFLLAITACSQTKQPDCNDAQGIKQFLEQKGFIGGNPIKVVGKYVYPQSEFVMDFAGLLIEENGLNINMAQPIELDMKEVGNGLRSVGIVTKNENFCDNDIRKIIFNDFNKSNYDLSINIHIWYDPESDNYIPFMRFNEVDYEKMGK